MPSRRGIALAYLNGPIYAVGGLDDTSCFNTVERYDPESDSWSLVQPLNYSRGGVAVVAYRVGRGQSRSYRDKFCLGFDLIVLIS